LRSVRAPLHTVGQWEADSESNCAAGDRIVQAIIVPTRGKASEESAKRHFISRKQACSLQGTCWFRTATMAARKMMDELHLPPDLYWDARAQSDDDAWNWLRALVGAGRRTPIRSVDKANQVESEPLSSQIFSAE
jgi:hypothetical protein